MGTRRKVCIWYKRRRGEYIAIYPGQPKNTETVFPDQGALVEFARASRLVLKERVVQNVRNNHDRGGLRRMDMDRL